jgi:hypothetical protein
MDSATKDRVIANLLDESDAQKDEIAALKAELAKAKGKQVTAELHNGEPRAPRRCAGICRLKPEMYEQYTQLHDHTWDEVMERMYKSNMRNFVVYYHKETGYM